jgi:hypothetical protein
VGIIAAEALGAAPDRVATIEVGADGDAEAGAGAAPGLLGELQGDVIEGDDVIERDGAVFLVAEDEVEGGGAERDKGGGGIGRGPREL